MPIILSVSVGAGRSRPLGITLGIITSFTVFTLSISYLEKAFHIDPNSFRVIAVIALILLGVSMLFSSFAVKLEELVNYLLRPLRGRIKSRGSGFTAGYAMGFATGLIWAPCSGPILATIATLAATQSVNLRVVAVTLAYVAGLGIPLFLFSLAGNRLFDLMRRFTRYTVIVQQAFGVMVIIAALLIYTNYDKAVQLKILQLFPSYGNFARGLEGNKEVTKELRILSRAQEARREGKEIPGRLPDLGPAPEFTGISRWLNTPVPLTMAGLRGKVVLVDFWTYTCINCVRELPHVVDWHKKYKKYNLVVVGVHTPEFAFEKETRNVENAVKQLKIDFPVAQDNAYHTWRAFDNHYWPAVYLIDAKGRIRMTHFGEGEYDRTEKAIRELLEESGNPPGAAVSSLKDQTPGYRITPETYLGMVRMERFVSSEKAAAGRQKFSIPVFIPQDHFAYGGIWDISEESSRAVKGAVLEIKFKADKVFLVVRPHTQGEKIRIFLDGKPLSNADAGTDVKDSALSPDDERLYNLVDLRGKPGVHLLRLEFTNEGTEVYAFTFG